MRSIQQAIRVSSTMLTALLLLCYFQGYLTQNPCTIHFHKQDQGLAADCNFKNLTSVPQDLPASIVTLSLSGNKITSLRGQPFLNYKQLKILDLSKNDLSFFEDESFNNLSLLVSLDLHGNCFLRNSGSLWPELFKPLKHLQALNIHGSKVLSHPEEFPDQIFLHLQTVESLVIDNWPAPKYRKGFSYLHKLHELKILGVNLCNLDSVKNSSFSNLKKLPLVTFELKCHLSTVDTGVFSHFPNLTNLTVNSDYKSTVSLSNITECLHPFVGKNLTLLQLTDLQKIRDSSIVDNVLDIKTLNYLLDICLESLKLANNRISTVSSEIIDSRLFRCLKFIDLSRNHITGDPFVISQMHFMENLITIDLSYNRRFEPTGVSKILQNGNTHLIFKCPPKLKEILLHSGATASSLDGNVTLYNCENIQLINISNCGTLHLHGQITGLSDLSTLDVSNNAIFESFFQRIDFADSLETLRMSGSRLKFDVFSSRSFFYLKMLKELDLSLMNLQFISTHYITTLNRLATLNLRGNKFDTIPKEVTDLKSLTSLDMSSNSLRVLKPETRDRLENIYQLQGQFDLILKGNIFLCSCDTLDFISWLEETKINLDENGTYSCVMGNGEMTNTKSFHDDFIHQWRTCVGQRLFVYSLSAIFLLTLTLSAVFISQIYFPVIENNILKFLGYQVNDPPKRKDFLIDAYVCYGSADYKWPCHCLFKGLKNLDQNIRLHLPDLHDTPGDSKAESIIKTISESWKVVIVVSRDCFNDEWFHFSLLSTVRLFSSHNAITKRILLLYRDGSPEVKASVPGFIVNVLKDDNIMTFPDGNETFRYLYKAIMEDV